MKGGRRRPPNVDDELAEAAGLDASMKGGRRRPPNPIVTYLPTALTWLQ